MPQRNTLLWIVIAGCLSLSSLAPVTRAQGVIRVETNEVRVPAVVFDKKLDSLMDSGDRMRSVGYLVANDPHFWDSISIRGLVTKDFHLFEDGQEYPVRNVTVEAPTFSIVRDSMGSHPESVGTGGGRWSYLDRPEKDVAVWLPWPRYLIAYAPPASPAGSCHKIQVTVGRPNAEVWTRGEYCNTRHPATDPLSGTDFGKRMEEDLSSSKQSKIDSTMLVVPFFKDTGATRVYIKLDFPWESLTHEFKYGTLYATIGVMGMVYNKDGSLAARFSDFACCDYGKENKPTANAQNSGASYDQGTLMIPERYETQIELPPGEYEIRLLLSDGKKFNRQAMPLTVDRVDEQPLSVSGIAFSRRFRETPAETPEGPIRAPENHIRPVSNGNEFTPTANTLFKTNERIFTYFEIYEPQLTAETARTIQARMRIVDAKTGDLKKDCPPLNAGAYFKDGNPVIAIGRQINLGNLSKGAYRLEVQATDGAGNSTTWRTADFSVK
jgi:hypothetical protein